MGLRKAFQPTLVSPSGQVSKAEIVSRIAQLRADGLTPVTINTYLRSLNTFFRWLHQEGHWKNALTIGRLKEERKIIEAFNDKQIEALVSHKPKTGAEARVHLISCLILDSGARIDEVLSLERQDVDLDNLLLQIRKAKGGRARVVPISLQMRKLLFRFMEHEKPEIGGRLFFTGSVIRSTNGMGRDVPSTPCGIRSGKPISASAVMFSDCNGYSGTAKLEMTRRYVNLETSDLQNCH